MAPRRVSPRVLYGSFFVAITILAWCFLYPGDRQTDGESIMSPIPKLATSLLALQPESAPRPMPREPMDIMKAAPWKKELKDHYALALLTTERFHDRLKWALSTWWEPEFNGVIEVLSDSTKQNVANLTIPNLIDTGCENSYNFGLWCKNDFMLRRWRTDPKYKNVKWFYRGMDDSGVHLENLIWLTQQYDYRRKLVIGERICLHQDYPDGGPGFFISRGLVESDTLLQSWNESLTTRGTNTPLLDDVLWGRLISIEKAGLYHSNGISHHPYSPESEMYRYYERQVGRQWPLTYRPVLYHQAGDTLKLMPEVHRLLHVLNYYDLSWAPYTPPNCMCWGYIHARCSYHLEMVWVNGTRTACSWPNGFLHCYAPGPWPQAEGYDYRNIVEEVRVIKDKMVVEQEEKKRLQAMATGNASTLSPAQKTSPSSSGSTSHPSNQTNAMTPPAPSPTLTPESAQRVPSGGTPLASSSSPSPLQGNAPSTSPPPPAPSPSPLQPPPQHLPPSPPFPVGADHRSAPPPTPT